MKNKILLSLALLPVLCSCTILPDYNNGLKVQITASENGGLIETAPSEVYEYLITSSNSGLLYLGSSTCSTCIEASKQLDAYGKKNDLMIMSVEMNGITEENYQYLFDTTSFTGAAFALPSYGEDLYLPVLYLFLGLDEGSGVVSTCDNYFVDFLRKYVEVVH